MATRVKHTASGAIDHRANCDCRATDTLCPQCYTYGLRILLARGLGRALADVDRKLASLTIEQRTYMRNSRGWYWGG